MFTDAQVDAIYMFILTLKRRVIKLEPPVSAFLLNHFEVNLNAFGGF
jgi:hypothetical protein